MLTVMLKNGQTYFKNLAVFTSQNLKYVWPFFNIICERVEHRTKLELYFNWNGNNKLGPIKSGWLQGQLSLSSFRSRSN